jgi:hypothetical protein
MVLVLPIKIKKNVLNGKKTRKHGRNLRKPCKQRYTSAEVWELNKERRAQKLANKLAKLKAKRAKKNPEECENLPPIFIKIKVQGEWVIIKPNYKEASKDASSFCLLFFFIAFLFLPLKYN